MSMPLLSTKPTKFTDVNPGSTIEVTSTVGAYEPYETSVLEVRPEYGQNRIPAIIHKRKDSPGSEIIVADGAHRVKILLDSKLLQRPAAPEGSMRIRSVPSEFVAARFDGGAASAMSIISFAAGRSNIRWEQGTDQYNEALVLTKLEREDRITIGMYVLVNDVEVLVVDGTDLASKYELIEVDGVTIA